jgi:hypothetical protein
MCDTTDTSTAVDDVCIAPKTAKKPAMTRTTTTTATTATISKKAPRKALAKVKKSLSTEEQSDKVKLKISRSKETKSKNKASNSVVLAVKALDNSEITSSQDSDYATVDDVVDNLHVSADTDLNTMGLDVTTPNAEGDANTAMVADDEADVTMVAEETADVTDEASANDDVVDTAGAVEIDANADAVDIGSKTTVSETSDE